MIDLHLAIGNEGAGLTAAVGEARGLQEFVEFDVLAAEVEIDVRHGAIVARAVVSQRVNEGMMLMYHAQEKIVNTPGSEMTGQRGGIHNSVTRTVLKPTHMIGGYAQLAYGFNYYGTVGANRDEFVIVRKMKKVDWLDQPLNKAEAGQ